jgi:signal transduction histidine kinase
LVLLVEDILQLAKADTARTDIQISELKLDKLIEQTIDTFKSRFDLRQIRVETGFGDHATQIWADPPKLAQVIHNLVQNAWEYTPPSGHVRIATERVSDGVKVVLSNTGGEIAHKDLPFIFERFYRGEKSRSREHGGAGIGLAIVKELIEAHSGRVGAEISDGQTHIWFLLPFIHAPT